MWVGEQTSVKNGVLDWALTIESLCRLLDKVESFSQIT